MRREQLIKSINDAFSLWETKLSNLSSINLNDNNIVSEDIIKEILNVTYGYDLKNDNEVKKNNAAIDLSDRMNSIAFQVTTVKTTEKIKKAIKTFIENQSYQSFDQYYFFILGKKQKKYPAINTEGKFIFSPTQHILDFKDLLNSISHLPTQKLEWINNYIHKEHSAKKISNLTEANAQKLKRRIAFEKKFKKDFYRTIKNDEFEKAMFDPSLRFIYDRVLLRDVDDSTYPEFNEEDDKKRIMSAWIKLFPYSFYNEGITLVSLGQYIIMDKDDFWDVVQLDDRNKNSAYRVFTGHPMFYLPYDNIVDYTMSDDYVNYPVIFCKFTNNGTPFQGEYEWHRLGEFDKKIYPFKFNPEKRKKLP